MRASGYSAASVRQVCADNDMSVRRRDGEWRITFGELVRARDWDCAEAIAYYTDDNDDAVCTAIAMRKRGLK